MDRPLQISFRQMEPSEALETIIRERVDRLKKFHTHIVGARVVVEVPHHAPDSGKNALKLTAEIDVAGRPRIVVKSEEPRHDSKSTPTIIVGRVFESVERRLEDIAKTQGGSGKRGRTANNAATDAT